MKIKRHRSVTPVYRESGYAKRLPAVSKGEKLLWLGCFAVMFVSVLLILLARNDSGFVERYYSLSFYQVWAGIISSITKFIPFSLAEWIIVAFILSCLVWLITFIVQLVKYRHQTWTVILRLVTRITALCGAILLLFTISGGLNYYRYSFKDYSGLEVRPTELTQLTALCEELVQDANTLREGLAEDSAGVSRYNDKTPWELGKKAPAGYRALTAEHPEWKSLLKLAGSVYPKPVFFSEAMSYMQIVGVSFPYTEEANVNVHIIDYNIPNAMCHELAHISGFMREDEANFLAYLSCRANDDRFFRYSGVMLALVHSGNALYSHSPEAYSETMAGLSEAVKRDIAADSAYFAKYDTAFGRFSNAVNDTYLKANNQTDGVAAYGRMVDLLLADYRVRHNLT